MHYTSDNRLGCREFSAQIFIGSWEVTHLVRRCGAVRVILQAKKTEFSCADPSKKLTRSKKISKGIEEAEVRLGGKASKRGRF